MNLPNKLTVSRFALTVAFLVAFFWQFPGNETVALLSSFAIFGSAMVARPIGAIFFGHLGDRAGRDVLPLCVLKQLFAEGLEYLLRLDLLVVDEPCDR